MGDKLRALVRGDMGQHAMFQEYMGKEQLGEFQGVDGVMGRDEEGLFG